LHALDGQGREPDGWPKFTGGWIVGAPTVGDIDADGLLEVLLNTREGELFAWDTKGDAGQEPMWWGFHHDSHATGNYHADAEPPDAIDDLRVTRTEEGGQSGLLLEWTAAGDDGKRGRAAAYEIRSHSEPIDPFNWPEAQRVTLSLIPGESGARESVFLGDLPPGGFVAVRAVDDAGNLSGIYPAQEETPPAELSDGNNGGCGCAVFPGGGGRTGFLQVLPAILLYGLPVAWARLIKRRT
jgi:hypothetical protein